MVRAGARTALAALAVVAMASTTFALHRETPHPIRITSGKSHFLTNTRSADRMLAFISDQDVMGNGSTGRQLFLFNHLAWVCEHGEPNAETLLLCATNTFPIYQQITFGPGDPDNPSIDEDATKVYFDALGTFDGGSDGTRRQIFMVDLLTGAKSRVTNFFNADSTEPQISPGGGLVAFQSTVFGCAKAPGSKQVWLHEVSTGLFHMVTCGIGVNSRAQISGGGRILSFESTSDLRGDGHNTGINQIFYAKVDRRPFTTTIYQLTDGNQSSEHSYLSPDGNYIAFDSTATNLRGHTQVGTGPQIYSGRTDAGNLPQLTQYTTAATYGNCTYPAIDSVSSGHILFLCTGDPLQNGTTGNRVFLLDTTKSPAPLWQLTVGGNVQGPMHATMGQWFLLLSTEEDMSGEGNCGHQIYLVDYFPERFIPATQIGQLPPQVNPGNPDAACSDGNPCSVDACGVDNECMHLAQTGDICQYKCTEIGTCSAGQCVAQPNLCDDADPCTTDACDLNSGCHHTVPDDACFNCAVAAQCQEENTCSVGACTENVCGSTSKPNGVTCDSDECRDNQTCAGGQCGGGTQTNCDDGDACTDEICDMDTGCAHVERQNCRGCDIDADCVTGNTCVTGYCIDNPNASVPPKTCAYVNQPNNNLCNDGNLCNGQDFCANGLCLPTQSDDCDDHDPCTTDACGLTGCTHTPDPLCVLCNEDSDCPDADPCTIDKCYHGVCGHKAAAEGAPCNDGDACNGLEQCQAGACVNLGPLMCDDGVGCTVDTCDPGTGCVFTADVGNCNDGDACTDDFCHATLGCLHQPRVCNDGNSCTDDSCDSLTGCFVVNNTAPCNDLNSCTTGDTCNGGICQPGGAVTCDDGNLCTTDTCVVPGGCIYTPSVVCSDNDVCNGVEACDPGTGTCMTPTALNCDDNDACTTDSCDAVTGCGHGFSGGISGFKCFLTNLHDDLEAAIANGAYLKNKTKQKLRGQVARAIAQVESADRASGQYRRKHLFRVRKILFRGFMRTQERAMQKGVCVGPECQGLMDRSQKALDFLQPLVVLPDN